MNSDQLLSRREQSVRIARLGEVFFHPRKPPRPARPEARHGRPPDVPSGVGHAIEITPCRSERGPSFMTSPLRSKTLRATQGHRPAPTWERRTLTEAQREGRLRLSARDRRDPPQARWRAGSGVVARPHADWGEEIIAFVVQQPGAASGVQTLGQLRLNNIARFMRAPRICRFVAGLPKDDDGKNPENRTAAVADRRTAISGCPRAVHCLRPRPRTRSAA